MLTQPNCSRRSRKALAHATNVHHHAEVIRGACEEIDKDKKRFGNCRMACL